MNHEHIVRVISEEKDLFKLQLSADLQVWGEPSGKLRFSATSRLDLPAVGDWVVCLWQPDYERAIIKEVVKRKTCLFRKSAGETSHVQILAANVDTAFVVTSANQEFNLRRLERYLAMINESGAQAVILLTKCDLALDNINYFLEQIKTVAPKTIVHPVSVVASTGLDALDEYLKPDSVSVFLGSSGVGKSTLTNFLLKEDVLETKPIREGDSRGRHTTTRRQLFTLPNGAIVIDTPGIRLLKLLDHEEGFASAFDDIENLFQNCKFTNCQHKSEPGCAVLMALENQTLEEKRYKSYLKLKRELDFEKRKSDKAAASAEKERWKKLHKQVKEHTKFKKRI